MAPFEYLSNICPPLNNGPVFLCVGNIVDAFDVIVCAKLASEGTVDSPSSLLFLSFFSCLFSYPLPWSASTYAICCAGTYGPIT